MQLLTNLIVNNKEQRLGLNSDTENQINSIQCRIFCRPNLIQNYKKKRPQISSKNDEIHFSKENSLPT